ncbi:MAG: hypothetical protein AAB692_04990 [Patescibacteria group bacterium]
MNSSAKWSFWLGLVIVAATHVYMLALGLPPAQMTAHAVLNLVAATLMTFGWSKR